MTRVAVVCGVGGAGKTTLSAALGIRWAVEGSRVAVLTIDPARRLADALACLYGGVDLLVTPDSALAHLAGASGIPAHVLLPVTPDWCWGLEQESPWYPGLRLLRSTGPGGWQATIEALRSLLEAETGVRA